MVLSQVMYILLVIRLGIYIGILRIVKSSTFDCITDVPGLPHPTKLVETSGLACVQSPLASEKLLLLEWDPQLILKRGDKDSLVSQPQIESVMYAFRSHREFFIDRKMEIPMIKPKKGDVGFRASVEEFEGDGNDIEDDEDEEMEDSNGSDSSEFEDDDEFENMDYENQDDLEEAMQIDGNDENEKAAEAIAALGRLEEDERAYRRGFFIGDGTGITRLILYIGLNISVDLIVTVTVLYC